jgi:hypothetical protein
VPKKRKRAFLDIAIRAAQLAGQSILDNLGQVSKKDID